MVEIKGEAIMAGSRPIFFASIGKAQPISFAIITTEKIVNETAPAS